MIIYIDGILVSFKTTWEHVEHLEYVLNKLHENKLFVNMVKSEFAWEEMNFLGHIYVLSKLHENKFFANKVKCEFARKEMNFLGHILSWEGVRFNPKKL